MRGNFHTDNIVKGEKMIIVIGTGGLLAAILASCAPAISERSVKMIRLADIEMSDCLLKGDNIHTKRPTRQRHPDESFPEFLKTVWRCGMYRTYWNGTHTQHLSAFGLLVQSMVQSYYGLTLTPQRILAVAPLALILLFTLYGLV